MSARFFSGRECWVYRAHALAEPSGHHPDLIDQALQGAEPDYLVYSPLRETNRGPFGSIALNADRRDRSSGNDRGERAAMSPGRAGLWSPPLT